MRGPVSLALGSIVFVAACSFNWTSLEPLDNTAATADGGGGHAVTSSPSTGGSGATTSGGGDGGDGGFGGAAGGGGVGGGGSGGARACTSFLMDTFQDQVTDSHWISVVDPGVTFAEDVAGMLRVDGPVGLSADAYYDTAAAFNFVGGQAVVELADGPNAGDDGSFTLRITEQGMRVEATKHGDGELRFRKNLATNVTLATIPYDEVAMRWWRLRNQAGFTYLDTSPDGAQWTEQHGVSDSELFDMTNVTARLLFHVRGAVVSSFAIDNVSLCN